MLIDIKQLAKKYNINSKGVLHIGAHLGQEADTYAELGMSKMIFIEANPAIYNKLLVNIQKYPEAIAINACISDQEGQGIDFNIASNDGQSSSILNLGTHKDLHPDVSYVGKMGLRTTRMDTILKNMDISGVDFLNIDIQGMELPALKSMGELLKQFNYAYLEVNREQVYEGCAEIGEVDAFLKDFGFVRKETDWVNGWGDAFYVKGPVEVLPGTFSDPLITAEIPAPVAKVKEEGLIVQVEGNFLPIMDNFEAWFGANITSKELKDRLYIPIQWTAYYSKNEWGRNTDSLSHVQYVLDNLDASKKYFTIVEWKEGILNYFKGKDIITFGPGDVNIDHKIDLTMKPEDIKAFILSIVNK